MSSRQPKGNATERVPVMMSKKWKSVIERAARKLNLSRSNYMAKIAYDTAVRELAKGA